MNKIIVAMICAVLSFNAYAGKISKVTSENNTTSQNSDVNGMITPEVATNMFRTGIYSYDKNRELLICPYSNIHARNSDICKDTNGNNAWMYMKDIVPKGKTLVGFKSVTQGLSHYIEIYWK